MTTSRSARFCDGPGACRRGAPAPDDVFCSEEPENFSGINTTARRRRQERSTNACRFERAAPGGAGAAERGTYRRTQGIPSPRKGVKCTAPRVRNRDSTRDVIFGFERQ